MQFFGQFFSITKEFIPWLMMHTSIQQQEKARWCEKDANTKPNIYSVLKKIKIR